jgi:hypothetical protein
VPGESSFCPHRCVFKWLLLPKNLPCINIFHRRRWSRSAIYASEAWRRAFCCALTREVSSEQVSLDAPPYSCECQYSGKQGFGPLHLPGIIVFEGCWHKRCASSVPGHRSTQLSVWPTRRVPPRFSLFVVSLDASPSLSKRPYCRMQRPPPNLSAQLSISRGHWRAHCASYIPGRKRTQLFFCLTREAASVWVAFRVGLMRLRL